MLKSMTGFGEAHSKTERQAISVQIKSVNNRYLKVLVRLPDSHAALEGQVERRVRETLTRGTVSVNVRILLLDGPQPYRINEPVVRAYLAQLADMGAARDAVLPSILALPGVVDEGQSAEIIQEDWRRIEATLYDAIQSLEEMRLAEGRAMQMELHANIATIRDLVQKIATLIPTSVSAYRERIGDRVNALLADHGVTVATNDLIREVAIFAERTDVSEEITRLRSHADQFDQLMDAPEATGRKLEFLAQEMFRECNTIGAKSGDVTISACVIELKSCVERIRELIANVE